MTQEEKAKAYDEALERANELYNRGYTSITSEIFPELAESEDEKVRKELIVFLEEFSKLGKNTNFDKWETSDCANWIVWLENVPVTIDHEKREGFHLGYKACLEKQGEQKPEENKGNIGGISPNSAWSEEDECYMSECIGAIATKDGWSFDEKRKTKHWLKSLKDRVLLQPKQKWSEEDERVFDSVIGDILCADTFIGGKETASYKIDWLQSLKDRVQPQPKQEWSEEDEEILRTILSDGIRGAELDMLQVNWLKSLRPQNQWKPSELQLGCLSDAIEYYNSLGYPAPKLKELLDDLKKLKEE